MATTCIRSSNNHQSDAFEDKGIVWTFSKLIGSEVEVLTTSNERLHGVLDTFTRNASIVLKILSQEPEKHQSTLVISPEHYVCLTGKMTKELTRESISPDLINRLVRHLTDDAISSQQRQRQHNEDLTETILIPWEDDTVTSIADELTFETNGSGWDSGNMLSTFEKANPGKTSYLGMEQYTNVEVPELNQSTVREISEIVDNMKPTDDDFQEDKRTEEEKFAAVKRTNKSNKSDSWSSHRHADSTSRGSHQQKPAIYTQSSRWTNRYPSVYKGSRSGHRDDAKSSEFDTFSGRESQSARSSPYPKRNLTHQQYNPRRGGQRGANSMRLSSNKNRYQGHPSLPLDNNRSNNATVFYRNSNSGFRSPLRQYESKAKLENDRKSNQLRDSSERNNCNTNFEVTKNNYELKEEVTTSPIDSISQDLKNVSINDSQPSSSDSIERETNQISQLDHGVQVFVPSRVQTSPRLDRERYQPNFDAGYNTPFADQLYSSSGHPAESLPLNYNSQLSSTERPRKVNMPVVENPFYSESAATRSQSSQNDSFEQEESRSDDNNQRRFMITNDEITTTVQLSPTPMFFNNNTAATTDNQINNEDSSDIIDGSLVIEDTFGHCNRVQNEGYVQSSIQMPANYQHALDFQAAYPFGIQAVTPQQSVAIQQQAALLQSLQQANQFTQQPSYPTYYIINPTALGSNMMAQTQPTICQASTNIATFPYQFCGYPATPLSILPINPNYSSNATTAFFVNQQDYATLEANRRNHRPMCRRYSESMNTRNTSDQYNRTESYNNRRGEGRRPQMHEDHRRGSQFRRRGQDQSRFDRPQSDSRRGRQNYPSGESPGQRTRNNGNR